MHLPNIKQDVDVVIALVPMSEARKPVIDPNVMLYIGPSYQIVEQIGHANKYEIRNSFSVSDAHYSATAVGVSIVHLAMTTAFETIAKNHLIEPTIDWLRERVNQSPNIFPHIILDVELFLIDYSRALHFAEYNIVDENYAYPMNHGYKTKNPQQILDEERVRRKLQEIDKKMQPPQQTKPLEDSEEVKDLTRKLDEVRRELQRYADEGRIKKGPYAGGTPKGPATGKYKGWTANKLFKP